MQRRYSAKRSASIKAVEDPWPLLQHLETYVLERGKTWAPRRFITSVSVEESGSKFDAQDIAEAEAAVAHSRRALERMTCTFIEDAGYSAWEADKNANTGLERSAWNLGHSRAVWVFLPPTRSDGNREVAIHVVGSDEAEAEGLASILIDEIEHVRKRSQT